MKHTLTFTKERETKNTIRYAEQAAPGKPPVLSTIYVQKWAAEGHETLQVTIESK